MRLDAIGDFFRAAFQEHGKVVDDTMLIWSFGVISGQIKRYQSIARWFIRDAFWRFRKDVISILAASGLALAMQIAALVVLLAYLSRFETGQDLSWGGRSFDPRASFSLLLGVATGLLLLFGVSSVLSYRSAVWTLNLGRRYEEFCAKRAIVLAGSHAGSPELRHWQSLLGRVLFSSPGRCGRVLRNATELPVAFATFLATFLLLLWLDAAVTLVLFLLFLLVAPKLYSINVRGAQYSLILEETSPDATKEKRSILTEIAERRIAPEQISTELDRRFGRGAIRESLDASVGRRRVVAESGFATSLMAGFAVFIILLHKGSDILATGTGWTELLVYFIALRMNLGSVVSAAQAVTSINRFYPQVSRYTRFVRDTESLEPSAASPEATAGMGRATATTDWRLELPRRGDLVGLVTPQSAPDALRKATIASALGLDPADIGVVAAPSEDGSSTLRSAFGFPDGFGSDELAAALGRLGLDKLVPRRKRIEMDAAVEALADSARWPRLSAGLALIAASLRGHDAVIVDEAMWRHLPKDQQKAAAELFSNTSLVILHQEMPPRPDRWGERFIVLTNGEGLLVWVDRQGAEQVGRRLKKLLTPAPELSAADDADDDEDETIL